MSEYTPAPAGGSDIKVPILIGAVVALLGANIYLYTQIDHLKTDLSTFRQNMVSEVEGLKESSAVTTQTARRNLTSLKDELETAKQDLETMKATWTEATTAANNGDLVAATEKGRTVQAKAQELKSSLGINEQLASIANAPAGTSEQ